MYKVTADKLRVRATNSTDSKIVGFIPQGENVMVLDSSNAKYFKVKLTNGEGFVSSEFLKRISPPTVKKAETNKPISVQTAEKDNSKTLFIALVAVIMSALLFFIFKFLNSKVWMVLATIIVLGFGYTFYLTFIVEKSVAGKYLGTQDAEYQYLEFKPNKTVIIHDVNTDSLISTSYDIEGDMIKFKQQENTIMLLIRDNNTLVGEGYTRGIFKKN